MSGISSPLGASAAAAPAAPSAAATSSLGWTADIAAPAAVPYGAGTTATGKTRIDSNGQVWTQVAVTHSKGAVSFKWVNSTQDPAAHTGGGTSQKSAAAAGPAQQPNLPQSAPPGDSITTKALSSSAAALKGGTAEVGGNVSTAANAPIAPTPEATAVASDPTGAVSPALSTDSISSSAAHSAKPSAAKAGSPVG